MENQKISLFTAILININIIIGSAFFLGAQGILQKSGALAPFTWIIWGIIILPIVYILAEFTKIYPLAGGVYVYSYKALGSFWGFLSGWGFFIGTVAGNAIIIYAFAQGFSDLFLKSALSSIGLSDFSFTIILILIFTFLNFANVNFLEKANKTFTLLKSIPLIFVAIATLFLFNKNNITQAPRPVSGFLETIPFVIFAYLGFECCCAITHQIKDGAKNAAKAILISFGLIMFVYTIIQFCFLAIFGINTTQPFLEILPKLTNNTSVINVGNALIQSAILSSFLGGFYAMFYANNWVLYAIAKEKNLPFSEKLTNLNKYGIPPICVIVQALITIIFLFITQNKFYLITMGDFGVVISYLLSAISFLFISFKNENTPKLIWGILATLSSGYFLYVCFNELMISGVSYIIPFIIILSIGIVLKKISGKD